MTRVPLPPVMGRAAALLRRGRGADAAALLAPLLQGRTPQASIPVRTALADAWLLQGRLTEAETALGPLPLPAARPADGPSSDAAALHRLHGRVAVARGHVSRAIALLDRALGLASAARDPHAIGLARYELALCYKQVGDAALVREHIAEAAAALHAAGDHRHLALTHSLSGVLRAQQGEYDAAEADFARAARLAQEADAEDVCGIVAGNQAALALLRHRHDDARALAEEAVDRHARVAPGHGLAPALATLGQIYLRMGHLDRAEVALSQALEARTEVRHREVTGAVHDSWSQLALLRGAPEAAEAHLQQARAAYGAHGAESSHWYQWSLRVLDARLALARGALVDAAAAAEVVTADPAAPPADAAEAALVAAEAALAQGRFDKADARLASLTARLSPQATPMAWADLLRLRGHLRRQQGRLGEAYHDLAQSVSLCTLMRAPHLAARGRAALAQVCSALGRYEEAARLDAAAHATLTALGAASESPRLYVPPDDGAEATSRADVQTASPDADDRLVRRLVDAAALPEWLAHELADVLVSQGLASCAVVGTVDGPAAVRVEAVAGTDERSAHQWIAACADPAPHARRTYDTVELGEVGAGRRWLVTRARDGLTRDDAAARVRVLASVARQGFALAAARAGRPRATDSALPRPLTPPIPGFICASASMTRLLDQIARVQGHDLTVLITGESGTGKDLVARAIHAGSRRRHTTLLPFNCTTATRELVDSQLFGHRRGAFTGAVSDQRGLMQAASGGTLFLDEVGDLPLEVQPRLLRVLEQGDVLPIGETHPITVDVRVLAATNANLEAKVAAGLFREDLFYRLNVIRLQVPPLRERRDEVAHLAAFFLREACDRLGKPDVELDQEAIEWLESCPWPGNVRQLRNEVQRAVAMAAPGTRLLAAHLSSELRGPVEPARPAAASADGPAGLVPPLAARIEALERQAISEALLRHAGNVSETARVLGLTRRGLYLKMRRLGLGVSMNDVAP